MTKKCKKMQKKKVQKSAKPAAGPSHCFFMWKFPTCQGNMSPVPPSFSASALSAGPQLQALDRSVRRQTRTASTGSECSPPDLNCKRWLDRSDLRRTPTASSGSDWSRPDLHHKLRIRLFPAGLEQQAQDQSDPRWTSTASARSQCSPPDPNSKHRIRGVIPAGPQLQALDRSVRRQTRTASTGSEEWSPPDLNCKRWLDRSVLRRTSTAISGSERSPRTSTASSSEFPTGPQPQRTSDIPARKNVRRYTRDICQKECQNSARMNAWKDAR